MPRSAWKIPFVSNKLSERVAQSQFFSDIALSVKNTEKSDVTELSVQPPLVVLNADRFSTITSDMIGAKVMIHNGLGFRVLKIRKNHLGLKYGEFAYTRIPVKHKIVVAKKAPTKK